MIKAVLFDLDGTLLDTNQLILDSFKHTFKTILDLEVPEEEMGKIFGKPLVGTLASYNEEKVDELVKEYRRYNEENHDNMCKPFEGVQVLLKSLKDHGYKLGIVTSKRLEMAKRGSDLGDITKYFDIFITPESTEKHKPNPEPIYEACKQIGIEPKEAIMVGDAPADILSGKNAGAITCAVRYTALPISELEKDNPDYFIDYPLQILDILKGINVLK